MSIDLTNWVNTVGSTHVADGIRWTCAACENDNTIDMECRKSQLLATRCNNCRTIHILNMGNATMADTAEFGKAMHDLYHEDMRILHARNPISWGIIVYRHMGMMPGIDDETFRQFLREVHNAPEEFMRKWQVNKLNIVESDL